MLRPTSPICKYRPISPLFLYNPRHYLLTIRDISALIAASEGNRINLNNAELLPILLQAIYRIVYLALS